MRPRPLLPSLLLASALALPSILPAEDSPAWTRWGGPGEDFRAPAARLADHWGPAGPREIWTRELGDGYSTVLVEDGRLYTMARLDDQEAVVALDAASGETVWEHRYAQDPRPDHVVQFGTGPRATPLVAGERIFAIGVAGRLTALRKADGEALWSRELWGEELGGNFLQHGYSSSPVAVGDTVIALVGGDEAGIVAFAQADGAIRWKSTGFENDYATPRVFEIAGRRHLVASMNDHVVGLDPGSGEVLWSHPTEDSAITPPVLVDGRILFLSSVQGGSTGLALEPDATGRIVPRELWSSRKVRFFHVTNIADDGWVYGSSGAGSPAFLAAIDARTGEVSWRERGFGKANVVAVGERLLVLDEDGVLALASATRESFSVASRAQLLERVAWTAPTVVGSTLYVRDTRTIRALDLAAPAAPGAAVAAARPADPPPPAPAPPLGDPPADASEALRILYRVDAAARAVESVRFTAEVRVTGAATSFAAESTGSGVLSGWDGFRPARFRVDLETRAPGSDEPRRLAGGGDGDSFFLVDHGAKTAWEDIDPNVMGSASGAILNFGIVEYVHPTPFSDEVGAEGVELAGSEEVAGVDCWKVVVDYGGRARSTWFFGKEDLLPRRRIRHVTDREGNEGTVETTLTAVEIDPALDDAMFRLELPEGYERIADFAP